MHLHVLKFLPSYRYMIKQVNSTNIRFSNVTCYAWTSPISEYSYSPTIQSVLEEIYSGKVCLLRKFNVFHLPLIFINTSLCQEHRSNTGSLSLDSPGILLGKAKLVARNNCAEYERAEKENRQLDC